MKKALFGAAAGLTVLSGCNTGTGLGDRIESCRMDFETTVGIELNELVALQNSSVDWIKDPTAGNGFFAQEEQDKADKQGELACINKLGDLVLTRAGLALQSATFSTKP